MCVVLRRLPGDASRRVRARVAGAMHPHGPSVTSRVHAATRPECAPRAFRVHQPMVSLLLYLFGHGGGGIGFDVGHTNKQG